MVDGVELTDQIGLGNLSHLTIDNVERIEVVRGPQSALYGADALSGVINIITKKGEGPPQVTASLQAGNLDNNLETAGLSGGGDGYNYSVSASHFGTENVDNIKNDRYDNIVFSARAGFNMGDDVDLSFILRYQDAEVQSPGPTEFLPEDPDDDLDTREVTFTTIYEQRLTDWWGHAFQASYFEHELVASDPEAQDLFNDAVFENDTMMNRVSLDYKHDFTVFQDHVITVGTNWEQEQADIVSSDPFSGTTTVDEERRNLAFYAQAALSFWERLDVVAGVRHDDSSVFGSEVTPRVAVSYLVKETDTRLKGSYGEGIKNPTFLDLFFNSPPFFFGNPNLGPEKNRAWDIGVEQGLFDGRLTVGATYFRSDFDDLIATVETAPFVFSPVNLDSAVSKGVELEATAQLPYHLTLRGAYTFTETEDDEGDDLIRIPKHLASVNLNYSHKQLMLNLAASVASERSDLNFAFVDENGDFVNDIADDEANGYVRLDMAGEYKLNDNISIVARVENLLDDEHFEDALGFENPGVNFLAGVKAVF
ncbi:MAG: TonB-dependent receptor [Candidatus Lindowbacteria bacterium]|nr:TonB-dependent receptor [Candidatus Lindowbacteria bacterium]